VLEKRRTEEQNRTASQVSHRDNPSVWWFLES
jgi:hypothetical protein